MSEELRETVEIIRIGSEYSIQLLGITKEALQAIFAVANSIQMDRAGSVSFKKLMKNCADKGLAPIPLSFPSEDQSILTAAEQMLKEMNVQFARMPDYIQGDNETQYLVSSEQAHFFNAVAKRLYDDEVKRIKAAGGTEKDLQIKGDQCSLLEGNDYMNYVPQEDLEKAKQTAIEQSNDPHHDMDKESRENFFMSNREEQTRNNPEFERISIDKNTLLLGESNEHIFFRIPGTEGKEFVQLRKGDLVGSDAKSYTFAINQKEQFPIYDRSKTVIKTYDSRDFLAHFSEPKRSWPQGRNFDQKKIRQMPRSNMNR